MNPSANDAENVHKSPPPPHTPDVGRGVGGGGGVGDGRCDHRGSTPQRASLIRHHAQRLAGGDCPGKRGLYCDGRPVPPVLMDRNACPDGAAQLRASGNSSFCCNLHFEKTIVAIASRHGRPGYYSSRPMPLTHSRVRPVRDN